MAQQYSVEAVLSAVDKNFSKTFGKAQGVLGALGKATSGIAFGAMMEMGRRAFDVVASGAQSIVADMNDAAKAWKTFEGNMKQTGGEFAKNIDKVRGDLQKFATQTIYSASDMSNTYGQLAAVMSNKAPQAITDLVTGFAGLASAATEPTQAMKTLSQQATQMAAKPKVAWQDFKLMLEQTPAGISAVAKEMGMTTQEMITAVQDGKVETEAFFDAITKVGNNPAFSKMATTYQTIDQAMSGLTETLANKLAPAFDVVTQAGIKAIEGLMDKIEGFDVEGAMNRIKSGFNELLPSLKGVGEAFKGFKASIATLIAPLTGMAQSTLQAISPMDVLKGALKGVQTAFNVASRFIQSHTAQIQSLASTVGGALKSAFQTASNFVKDHASQIKSVGDALSKIAPYVAVAVAAFAGFKKVGSFFSTLKGGMNGTVSSASSFGAQLGHVIGSVGNMLKSTLDGLGSAFQGIGKGLGTAFQGLGKGLSTSLQGIAKAFNTLNPSGLLMFAGVVGTLTASFLLLSNFGQGIVPIIDGIASAFASAGSTLMAGFANALLTLSPILPTIASSLAMLSPLVVALGTAVSSVFTTLPPIITAFGSAFASVVTAVGGAVSQIASAVTPIVSIIGSVFTNCVSIVSSAIVSIVNAIAPFIPSIESMVSAVASAVSSVASAFSTMVSQVAPAINSVSNLVSTFGSSISSMFESAGSVIESFGSAVQGVLNGVSNVISSIGSAARNAGEGFNALANGVATITALPLADMGASLATVATGVAGIATAGAGLSSVSASFMSIGSAMTMMSSSAKSAVSGINGVVSGATSATSAMSSMSSAVSSAMAVVVSTIASSAGSAGSAMQSLTNSVTQATQSGFTKAANTVKQQMNNYVRGISQAQGAASSAAGNVARSAVTALNRYASTAYSYGSNMSASFARGIAANVGAAQAQAARLAQIAAQVIAAKAQIGSPSRVTTKLGKWFGQGWVNGIADKVNDARQIAEQLMYIPAPATPAFALWGGELSSEFDYSANGAINITVVSEIDGREVARTTEKYMSEEQSRQKRRNDRKKGVAA